MKKKKIKEDEKRKKQGEKSYREISNDKKVLLRRNEKNHED